MICAGVCFQHNYPRILILLVEGFYREFTPVSEAEKADKGKRA
jgi:hypothetical protein